MKENAKLLALQVKLINKTKVKIKEKSMTTVEKKLVKVQKKLKNEIKRNDEFTTWGFHDYIISYVVKVRVLEDLIDCAQKV